MLEHAGGGMSLQEVPFLENVTPICLYFQTGVDLLGRLENPSAQMKDEQHCSLFFGKVVRIKLTALTANHPCWNAANGLDGLVEECKVGALASKTCRIV